jgi:peptide/nickel transport system substrate-binding protein
MPNRTRKRNLSRRSFLQMGAASAGIFLVDASRPAPLRAATPKRGGTFTLARTQGLTSFNPFNLASPGTWAVERPIHSTLAYYDLNLKAIPDLAESWTIPPDGKSVTVKLRQGVKFHNGKEFTSEDVRFSCQFASTDPSVFMITLFKIIESVDTPDKYTAKINFKQLVPAPMDILDQLWMIDKDAVKDFPSKPNGTGPYKLETYVPNDRAELVPHKDYFIKGKQYVDRYIAKQIPDTASLSINLESGAIDCMWRASVLDAARLKPESAKYVTSMGAPGQGMYDIALNVKWGPFQNKKVRQAIAWAVDRERFTRTAMKGLIEPTCLMWPKHTWAYFPDMEKSVWFNLDKARALLKEGGYDKGFDVEILSSTSRVYGFKELAEILQADLKQIGINAKITDAETAVYNRRMNAGDMQIMVHNYGRSNRDPGTMVTAAKAWYVDKEGGWSHYESAEYEKIRDELQSTTDPEKRRVTARKIQEMMLDESFTIVVAPQPTAWVWRTYVKDLRYDLENSPFVHELWLDK